MKTAWSDATIISELATAAPRPHYHYLRRALRAGESLLEVGCATSALFDYLVRDAPAVRLAGCDLTTEMLNLSRAAHPQATYFEADVQDMADVPDAAYDWVVCSDVLIHVPDPDSGLRNLWRVTRGALLFVVRESDFHEDVVDLKRAYQGAANAKFHYNVWNRAMMRTRLERLMPSPRAIDAYRYWIHLPPDQGGPVLAFDQTRYPLWASSYALLKDPACVRWLGSADRTFSKKNLFQRVLRKASRTLVGPYRWDPE